MGEYADDAIDRGFDEYRGSGIPRGGYGWGERPLPKTCRRCGKGGLYWRRVAGVAAWRLHHWAIFGDMTEPAYFLHRCGFQANGEPSVVAPFPKPKATPSASPPESGSQ